MNILYPPVGYKLADDTPFVKKGLLGNGVDADSEAAVTHVVNLIDDPTIVIKLMNLSHQGRLQELEALGFHVNDE